MKKVCTKIASLKNSFADNEILFPFSSIPTIFKKHTNIVSFHSWITLHVKKPNLAFPFGISLSTASKKSEYLRQLYCTVQHSQNLQSKHLEINLEHGKDLLVQLSIEKQSKKIDPSLLILFPNLGPTAFTYLYDLHKMMDAPLIKEGFVLCTFNPLATRSRNNKKLKTQIAYPPVPFIILRKLEREDIKYFKEQPKLEISYHHYYVLNPN
jgi:hypothetical protein